MGVVGIVSIAIVSIATEFLCQSNVTQTIAHASTENLYRNDISILHSSLSNGKITMGSEYNGNKAHYNSIVITFDMQISEQTVFRKSAKHSQQSFGEIGSSVLTQ